MPSNHLIFCHPLLFCLQSFPALGSFPRSQIFTSGGQNIGASASANSHSNEYSGLISLKIDWFDILAVWGTLKSLLQHSLIASILWYSAFFMVQLSHLYMTTGNAIALTIQTFVRKLMSLLFNMLCRGIIAFLPRSKHSLSSWLQPLAVVILEPKKIKSATVYIVSPSICHGVMGQDAMICFLNVEF